MTDIPNPTEQAAREAAYAAIDKRIQVLNLAGGCARKGLNELPDSTNPLARVFIVEMPDEWALLMKARDALSQLELACLHRAFEEAHRAFWGKTTKEICDE